MELHELGPSPPGGQLLWLSLHQCLHRSLDSILGIGDSHRSDVSCNVGLDTECQESEPTLCRSCPQNWSSAFLCLCPCPCSRVHAFCSHTLPLLMASSQTWPNTLSQWPLPWLPTSPPLPKSLPGSIPWSCRSQCWCRVCWTSPELLFRLSSIGLCEASPLCPHWPWAFSGRHVGWLHMLCWTRWTGLSAYQKQQWGPCWWPNQTWERLHQFERTCTPFAWGVQYRMLRRVASRPAYPETFSYPRPKEG